MLLKKPLKIETYVEGTSDSNEGKPAHLRNLVRSYFIFFDIQGILLNPMDLSTSYILSNGNSYAVDCDFEELQSRINECRKK